MSFGKDYSEYWASTIKKSVDGTLIAGPKEVEHFLDKLQINKPQKVLDLGCSFGRMFDVLSRYFEVVYGVELDPYAITSALPRGYEEILVGKAEQIGFSDNFFDFVFCWAVFDVVDHVKGLTEISRVLRVGGKLLITGKHCNYLPDDELAYKAEKNAFLKKFPNRFTNLESLADQLTTFGLKLDKLFIFSRRGDLGLLKYSEKSVNDINDELYGYEYLAVCEKICQQSAEKFLPNNLESQFSRVAIAKSVAGGYGSPLELFEATGIT
jgi:ubiquinone/menaquinone biosynthesis C-methylase UbiE